MFKIPTGEDGLWPFIAEEMGRTDFCSAQGTLGSVVLQQETTIPNAKRMGYIAVFYWGGGGVLSEWVVLDPLKRGSSCHVA